MINIFVMFQFSQSSVPSVSVLCGMMMGEEEAAGDEDVVGGGRKRRRRKRNIGAEGEGGGGGRMELEEEWGSWRGRRSRRPT